MHCSDPKKSDDDMAREALEGMDEGALRSIADMLVDLADKSTSPPPAAKAIPIGGKIKPKN